ncbi:glycerate kinase [Thiomicrospira cyclica]|uniref:Glycerate kinase n=1 Tax=Thiomicrospira cyclica (strain DSM 14477 / JCM 11371 / ALM1) TaxID=717773 RepID=F6DAZ9_THICA|nr:glycerate kinase [Thiomicrospira cyclica]AEG32332.1 glycerate kinase [Thiomicrospira cyclica ALM1]
MPRILIAPDSFKGSLSAVDFCRISQQLIQQHWPEVAVISRPLSDGGEGFVDAFCYAGLAQSQSVETQDPLGRNVTAHYAWQASTQTAIVEMAQASGLPRLAPNERNPLHTSSYGAGLIIKAAIERGAQRIILGLGGSATNDGGVGALQALGIPCLDKQGRAISQGGGALQHLASIGEIPPHLQKIEWLIACDVTNPLTGPQGATAVYGPQKGLQPEQFTILENGLAHFADLVKQQFSRAILTQPGAGAAGGMAGGFIGILGAQTQNGFDLLAEATEFKQLFEQPNQPIDLVITGEGKLDAQTRHGKLPMRVAQLAQQHQVPTLALCGQLAVAPHELNEFLAIFSLVPGLVTETHALDNAPAWLEQRLYSALKLFYRG